VPLIVLDVYKVVAVVAFPDKAPVNLVATNSPAVVERYTPESNINDPVLVDPVEVPVIYALVVLANVHNTLLSVTLIDLPFIVIVPFEILVLPLCNKVYQSEVVESFPDLKYQDVE
jgi:hypothetical protein